MKVEQLIGVEEELVIELPGGQRFDAVVTGVNEATGFITVRIMGAVELDDELPGADS